MNEKMTTDADANPVFALLTHETERGRFRSLQDTLRHWVRIFEDERVLDFGCSWGTSAVALIQCGAREVVGVDPDEERVVRGHGVVGALGMTDRIDLQYSADTSVLPWPDGTFPFVLANGVVEHIPRSDRPKTLREIWRVLAPGGHFMIAETPNSYIPKDQHTTQLWFNHWLPEEVAHRRAVRKGTFEADRPDWATSGWRGAGYFELLRPLQGARLIPEPITRPRHRILAMLGLPPMLIDPWPLWVFRKPRVVSRLSG